MACFKAQVGAFCWVHAINVSLGCQILQIALSREMAGAYYNEHKHATFYRNGLCVHGVIHNLSNQLGTKFKTKMLSKTSRYRNC